MAQWGDGGQSEELLHGTSGISRTRLSLLRFPRWAIVCDGPPGCPKELQFVLSDHHEQPQSVAIPQLRPFPAAGGLAAVRRLLCFYC